MAKPTPTRVIAPKPGSTSREAPHPPRVDYGQAPNTPTPRKAPATARPRGIP